MIISNFRDINGEAVQPYYAAFMVERGYLSLEDTRAEAGSNCDFMEWVNDSWNEFFSSIGVKRPPFSRPYAEKFTEWLDCKTTDRIARLYVEAA